MAPLSLGSHTTAAARQALSATHGESFAGWFPDLHCVRATNAAHESQPSTRQATMRQNEARELVPLDQTELTQIEGGGPTNCIGTYDEDGNLIGTCTDPSGVLSKLLGGGRPY
jgi:guanyl-specific ribonuclease Sa